MLWLNKDGPTSSGIEKVIPIEAVYALAKVEFPPRDQLTAVPETTPDLVVNDVVLGSREVLSDCLRCAVRLTVELDTLHNNGFELNRVVIQVPSVLRSTQQRIEFIQTLSFGLTWLNILPEKTNLDSTQLSVLVDHSKTIRGVLGAVVSLSDWIEGSSSAQRFSSLLFAATYSSHARAGVALVRSKAAWRKHGAIARTATGVVEAALEKLALPT